MDANLRTVLASFESCDSSQQATAIHRSAAPITQQVSQYIRRLPALIFSGFRARTDHEES